MNWGKGIAIALALFMSFIVYLAVTLMTSNVDLESEDYYLREIAYEEEIQAERNARSGQPIILELKDDHVVIKVPDEEKYSEVQVLFKRPDDDTKDKSFELTNSKMMLLERNLFLKGAYSVEISYMNNNKPCLVKDNIYI